MKKSALFLLGILFSANNAFAGSPEIWWATQVQCNVFMGWLSVHLTENWVDGKKQSYVGTGQHQYDSMEFNSCEHDDDSISCNGTSQFSKGPIKLVVERESDGTFSGRIYGLKGTIGSSGATKMGCLLTR